MAKVKTPSLDGEVNENAKASFSSKKMLADNSPIGKPGDRDYVAGTKIKYNDRMAVEIIEDTRYYKKGQVINPHKVKGQALIDQKLAKKFVEVED